MNIYITHIDTACVLIEINGFKILTDPTLDHAGGWYYHGFGSVSRKTDKPALETSDLKEVDLVLLSHHQHKDNFDVKGREFTKTARLIITIRTAARELPNAVGLENWRSHAVEDHRVPGLRITATPAQHRPWWVPEVFSGKVIGFIIEYDGQLNGVIYISGDTVYFDGIRQIADKYLIDVAVFHVGSVQFRYLTGFGHYTMDGKEMLKAVAMIKPNTIIPVHFRGWSHFKEKEQTLRSVIAADDEALRKSIFLAPGKRTLI